MGSLSNLSSDLSKTTLSSRHLFSESLLLIKSSLPPAAALPLRLPFSLRPAVFGNVALLATGMTGSSLWPPAQFPSNSKPTSLTYLSVLRSLLSLLKSLLPPERNPSLPLFRFPYPYPLLFFLANSSLASFKAAFHFLSSSSSSHKGSAAYFSTADHEPLSAILRSFIL